MSSIDCDGDMPNTLDMEFAIKTQRVLAVLDSTIQRTQLALCVPLLLRHNATLLRPLLSPRDLATVLAACRKYIGPGESTLLLRDPESSTMASYRASTGSHRQTRSSAAGVQQSRGSAEEAQLPRGSAEEAQQSRGSAEEAQQSRGSAGEAQQSRGSAEEAQQSRGSAEGAQQSRGSAEGAQQSRGSAEEAQQSRGSAEGAQQSRGSAEGAQQSRGSAEGAHQSRYSEEEVQQSRGSEVEAPQSRGLAQEERQSRGSADGEQQARGFTEAQQSKGSAQDTQQSRGSAEGEQVQGKDPADSGLRWSSAVNQMRGGAQDPDMSRALHILWNNAEVQDLVKHRLLPLVSSTGSVFLEYLVRLRQCAAERLSRSPAAERERETRLCAAWRGGRRVRAERAQLEERLQTQADQLGPGGQIADKALGVALLRHNVNVVRRQCQEEVKVVVNKSERAMVLEWRNSEYRQNNLQADLNAATEQLSSTLAAHLEEEKELRNKRHKMETLLLTWLQKFDTDVGEKFQEYQKLSDEFNAEAEQMKELTAKMEEQEEQYRELLEEKQRYEKEEEDELVYSLASKHAARVIQREWRAYRVRKRLAKTAKKKGKGKGKGKGKPRAK